MKVDDALALLRRGWSIIPCRAGSKIPFVGWGPWQKSPPTEQEVRGWWVRWPDANAAIVTGAVSGLVVVDIDPDKGGQIADIDEVTGIVVKTGGGGWHLYYKHPGHDVGNRAGLRPGIDIRGDGGYVIAPGSLHESGELYSFLTDGPTTECPLWVSAPVVRDERPPGEDKWLTRLLEEGCAEGKRNTSTAQLAGYYAKKAIPVDVAHVMVGQWSQAKLRPPLPADEVRTTVYSVYRTEEAKARSLRSNIVVGDVVEKGKKGKRPFTVPVNTFLRKYGALEPKWLCEGWMPDRTIAMIAAPPESLKSWMLLDMAVSVALGKPYLGVGKVADPGPVLMFQQEDDFQQVAERLTVIMLGKHGIKGDIWRTEKGHNTLPSLPDDNLPIYLHTDRELRFEEGAESLKALAASIERYRPRLVIIDSLYSTIDTENYGRDSVRKMFPLKLLRDRYGTSFILAHHVKKGADTWDREQMWGSQFLNAFIESGLQVRRNEGSELSCIVKPHFKDRGTGRHQWIDFKINTSIEECQYETEVRDATDDEIASAVARKEHKRAEKPDPYLRFYDWLCEHGPAHVKEAAEAMSESVRQTRRAFGKLRDQGKAFEVRGTVPSRWQAIKLT